MRRERTAAYHRSSSSSSTTTARIFWEVVVELVQRGAVHRAVERRGAASQAAQLGVSRQGVHGDVASSASTAAGVVRVGQSGHREGRGRRRQAEGLGGANGRGLL